MKPDHYLLPRPEGPPTSEFALTFDRAREARVLVIPALFDEANRLRRFSVEVMRRLDGAGIDSFLPDLPGTNESLSDHAGVTAQDWARAMATAARHFRATRVLAIRGGGLLVPTGMAGWRYGAVKGASLLRTLLRARVIAAREAGREESIDSLTAAALEQGLELAGYPLGADLFRELQDLVPQLHPRIVEIGQDLLGGSPLWLRAEPDDDAAQADALAAVVAMGIAA